MLHRNSLAGAGRLRLARCIVEDSWPIARAAERFQVARTAATKGSQRYRELGPDGMADRSSRPRRSPRRMPHLVMRKIVHLRWKQRLGPVAIAARVGVAASTVHRILLACRINRLWHVDRVTGEPIRRHEKTLPGEPVHVDIQKLGNILGGGWCIHGLTAGGRNSQAHRDQGDPARSAPGPTSATAMCTPPWTTTAG